MQTKFIITQSIVALLLILGISVVSVTAQTSPWSEPPAGTVAPANNTPAPINVSDATQSKGGNLILNADGLFASGLLVPRGDVTVGNAINDTTIGGSAKLKALGNVWADQYCDRSGGGCKSIADLSANTSPISWAKTYTLNAEPMITIPPGTQSLAITATGYAKCTLPGDIGSGVELEFKADGVTYARLRADAGNNNGALVAIRGATAGTVDVAGKTSVALTVTKNTYTYTGVIKNTGPFSSTVNCPSGSAMTGEVDSYIIYGIQSADAAAPTPAPTLTLTATPNPAGCGFLLGTLCNTTLSWSSQSATACTAASTNGKWVGDKPTSSTGDHQTLTINTTVTYSLTCSGPGGSVTKTVTVPAS